MKELIHLLYLYLSFAGPFTFLAWVVGWSNPLHAPMRVQFVKCDCWIGLFWKTEVIMDFELSKDGYLLWQHRTRWYLTLIPCLPIIWDVNKYHPLHKPTLQEARESNTVGF